MQPQGLAEVETYNREEGILMRFWYPIRTLERPTAGLARSSSLALCSEDRTRADLYCELLRNEACMTRMYCREANTRLLAKLAESHNQISGKTVVELGRVDTIRFPLGIHFFQLSSIDENSKFCCLCRWKS